MLENLHRVSAPSQTTFLITYTTAGIHVHESTQKHEAQCHTAQHLVPLCCIHTYKLNTFKLKHSNSTPDLESNTDKHNAQKQKAECNCIEETDLYTPQTP